MLPTLVIMAFFLGMHSQFRSRYRFWALAEKQAHQLKSLVQVGDFEEGDAQLMGDLLEAAGIEVPGAHRLVARPVRALEGH